jgi:hypothetical protein
MARFSVRFGRVHCKPSSANLLNGHPVKADDLKLNKILGISQTVIWLRSLKFSKPVSAFTEHGALMAANILNSPRAAAMSVYVIRAFVKMREDHAADAAILKRLAGIDKALLMHDPARFQPLTAKYAIENSCAKGQRAPAFCRLCSRQKRNDDVVEVTR